MPQEGMEGNGKQEREATTVSKLLLKTLAATSSGSFTRSRSTSYSVSFWLCHATKHDMALLVSRLQSCIRGLLLFKPPYRTSAGYPPIHSNRPTFLPCFTPCRKPASYLKRPRVWYKSLFRIWARKATNFFKSKQLCCWECTAVSASYTAKSFYWRRPCLVS